MTTASLAILHVLRAPVGGLFRHVLDLAEGQAARGHRVGIVAAPAAAGSQANLKLGALAPHLKLGVSRIPMQRQVGLGDFAAIRHVARVIANTAPDVVHGHGAKGGAYARLAPSTAIRVYTPHGGSLHYGCFTPRGLIYGAVERLLKLRTDVSLFESSFARKTYDATVGAPRGIARVVHNGVNPQEFEPVEPSPTAADLVTVGELRHLKGMDVLIEAIAAMARSGRTVSAVIVGEGPDEQELRALAIEQGLNDSVTFAGFRPARDAFALGKVLVVASRAESLPYVVLEAGAAGIPMVATQVGGIPEIFPDSAPLAEPGDPVSLQQAISAALDDLPAARGAAARLRERIRSGFSQDAMVEGVLAAYREALNASR